MNAEAIRSFCLSLEDVTESFPFDEVTLVFKTAGKMFLSLPLDEQPPRINVKCLPERAQELREQYACITPGYHMNKLHWNTIVLDGSLSESQVKEEIRHSYALITAKKTPKRKAPKNI